MAWIASPPPLACSRTGWLVSGQPSETSSGDGAHSSESVVLYATGDGVARITLNRPERLNASNGEISRGLTDAFTRAGCDPTVSVILLAGAGRGFCAGADQTVLKQLSAAADAPYEGSKSLRYDGIMLLPKPVIAAVHGPCVGIGLALACAADVRLAAEDAFFLAPFAAMGLCAEGGLAWSLPRLMGAGNAAEMLLSARRVGATEAYAKGLVSQVLPLDGFHAAALDYALAMARNAPASFAHMKRQLREADGLDFEAARSQAYTLTRATLDTADFKEAVAARGEQRKPAFSPVIAAFNPNISEG